MAAEELPLWFGVVYMVNMQMSFLSPPFGYALFYLKSVAPPQVSMAQIIQIDHLPFFAFASGGAGTLYYLPNGISFVAAAPDLRIGLDSRPCDAGAGMTEIKNYKKT